MKTRNNFLVCGVLLLGAVFSNGTEAAINYSVNTSNYWAQWIRRLPTTIRQPRSSRTPSTYTSPSYYSSKNRSSRTVTPTMATRKANVQRAPIKVQTPSRISQVVRLQVTPLKLRQTVSVVNAQPIRLFDIGVINASSSSSSDFLEALRLEKIEFQMFQNTGIAADPTKFRLRVTSGDDPEQEDSFQFNSNGKVTLQFNNARIAKGESFKIGISLVVDDPSATPNVPGSLRVRVLGAEASLEMSHNLIIPRIVGSAFSETIGFNPSPVVNGGTPVFTSRSSQQIFSKILSAGEKAYVLALGFEAHYDDMMIEEITVRDTLSNHSIDSFVSSLKAIDTVSGQVLGQTRFARGEATFHFWSPIRVNREDSRSIAFEAQINNTVDISSQNTRFKLEVLPADVVVSGYGSGRELDNADKNFSVDTETFLVVNSGGSLDIASSPSQITGFPVTESLVQIYKFRISNPGNRQVSIGRISMDIRPDGLDFPDGRSVDDFELRQMANNREVQGMDFNIQLGTGDTVIFDAGTEMYVGRNETLEFVLKVRLEDIAGDASGDSVGVRILGDNTLSTGTLASVRAAGAKFIWSDQSGRPHSVSSQDWLSGYLLPGLPTNYSLQHRQ